MPGDVVVLNAGDIVPGDCLVLESNELFVDEATLTGETYPVEKQPGTLPADTPLAQRTNSLFMGTHVVSGTATAVVVHTAKDDGVRPGLGAAEAAGRRDRVRARGAPLRLLPRWR